MASGARGQYLLQSHKQFTMESRRIAAALTALLAANTTAKKWR